MAGPYRDLTPIMRAFRDLISHRKIKPPVRFPNSVAPRTQPPPNLPDGPSGTLSANPYCTRDARRLNNPPENVFIAGRKMLPPPGADGAEVAKVKKSVLNMRPGFGYDYGDGVGKYPT